jgi:hypothetical protein
MASNRMTKVASVVGVTVVVLLLDILFVYYVTSHGFKAGTNELMIGGFAIQLQWLPTIGVLLVSLIGWTEVFTRLFPRWAGPEIDPLAQLRLARVITVSIAAFACFLYLPYLLGSNWFWEGLSHLSRSISQFRGFGGWLQSVELPILNSDAVFQYSVAQVVASGAMVAFAWIFARPIRRARKLR